MSSDYFLLQPQVTEPTPVSTTEVSVSHDQDAPPTVSGFARSQVNLTESQKQVVQALEEDGNVSGWEGVGLTAKSVA